jgi:hypothetical protein
LKVLIDRAIAISVSVAVTVVALPDSEVDDSVALGEAEASLVASAVGVLLGTDSTGGAATGPELLDEPQAASSARLVVAANTALAARAEIGRMVRVMVPPCVWIARPMACLPVITDAVPGWFTAG